MLQVLSWSSILCWRRKFLASESNDCLPQTEKSSDFLLPTLLNAAFSLNRIFPLWIHFHSNFLSKKFEITVLLCAQKDAQSSALSENSNSKFYSSMFQLLSIYYRYYTHCYCSSKCTANTHHIHKHART